VHFTKHKSLPTYGHHTCRGKIPGSLNGYFSRQQTSAIRQFSVCSYNCQSTAKVEVIIFTAHAHCFMSNVIY